MEIMSVADLACAVTDKSIRKLVGQEIYIINRTTKTIIAKIKVLKVDKKRIELKDVYLYK